MTVLITQSGFFFLRAEGFFFVIAVKMVFILNSVWIATPYCLFLVLGLTFGRPSLIPSLNSGRPWLNAVDYSSFEKPSYSSKSEEELPSERPPTKGKEIRNKFIR